MNLIDFASNCCGCGVCATACPRHAITMIEDSEGFLYPRVNAELCSECGLCKSKCSFQAAVSNLCSLYEVRATYAVKHKNYDIRKNSRSGGFFTAVSDFFLDKGGVVYGSVLDDSMVVKHVRAVSKTERDKMRESKYVQSIIEPDLYKQIKKDLAEGLPVLFTGTSCQIAAVRRYLGREYSNLFCIDIVCHGVPSPLVFRDIIQYWERKENRRVIGFDFRNKRYGWNTHIETVYFEGGKRKNSCTFTELFYQHNILRPSCFICPYKSLKHPGDITIADYWGIDQAAPGFNDNCGVSLVLVNSEFGEKIFRDIQNLDVIEFTKTEIEKSMQPPLQAPFKEPDGRKQFWIEYQKTGGIAEVISRNRKKAFLRKTKYYVKYLIWKRKR